MHDDAASDLSDVTEFDTLDVTRVDAVAGPANGMPFLLMKGLPDGVAAETDATKETAVEPDTEPDEIETSAEAAAEEVADAVEDVVESMPMIGDRAWERADAARGAKVAALLAEARSMLCSARESEVAELDAGVEVDADDVWDLDVALDCLDSALAIAARFAVTEAQEAADADADDETGVAKAGARLSAASMAHAKAARDELTALIGDAEEAEAEAKTDDSGAAGQEGDEPVSKEVAEAIASLEANLTAKIDEAVAKALGGETLAPIDAPADGVVKTDVEGDTLDVDETDVAKATEGTGEAALDAAGADPAEAPASASPNMDVIKASLEGVVKAAIEGPLSSLEARMATLEAQPAPGGPFLNTGPQPAGSVFGGAESVDQVTKALNAIKDPQERADVSMALGVATLAAAYQQ